MKKFEYFTRVMDTTGFFGGKIEDSEFTQILNELGQEGWELAEIAAVNMKHGMTRSIVCVFKRELA